MTTPVRELVVFVLARLAEDEEAAAGDEQKLVYIDNLRKGIVTLSDWEQASRIHRRVATRWAGHPDFREEWRFRWEEIEDSPQTPLDPPERRRILRHVLGAFRRKAAED